MVDHPDLPFEQSVNKSYQRGLETFLSQDIPIGVPRSRTWLDEHPTAGLSITDLGCLAGRVALDIDDPDLGNEFYVGVRYLSDRYFEDPVVGWDAPVAKIFYDPTSADHELLDHVTVRRTMSSHGYDLIRLDDDWANPMEQSAAPFSTKKLEIPQAPSRSGSTRRSKNRSSTNGAASGRRPAEAPTVPSITDHGTSVPDKPASPVSKGPSQRAVQEEAAALRRGMRSADAVQHALQAPRTQALSSVLATLQPDQYRLVAHPPTTPLVVQGHPGTGKTIIAVHRAAYLVSRERRDERVDKLLFLGPTNTWAMHVSGALKGLAEGKEVVVSSMEWSFALSGEVTAAPPGSC